MSISPSRVGAKRTREEPTTDLSESAATKRQVTEAAAGTTPANRLRNLLSAYPTALQMVLVHYRSKKLGDKCWLFSLNELQQVFDCNLKRFNESNNWSLLCKLIDSEENFDEEGWKERQQFMDAHACDGSFLVGQGAGAKEGQMLVATRVIEEEGDESED